MGLDLLPNFEVGSVPLANIPDIEVVRGSDLQPGGGKFSQVVR